MDVAISIHALHEEGDLSYEERRKLIYEFLSTPSMRRATFFVFRKLLPAFISIHALHEEGDGFTAGDAPPVVISIHALHEEGDLSGVPS